MLSYKGQEFSLTKILEVEKPIIIKSTLNTPTISINANGGYLNVSDYRNGNFTEVYRLYLNGEDTGKTFASKQIVLTDYEITETDEITVDCTAELFDASPVSNSVKFSDLVEGTLGLVYAFHWSGTPFMWTGIGTATADIIYVASILNGNIVAAIGDSVLRSDQNKHTVYLPDSITYSQSSFCYGAANKTIIFGANFVKLGGGHPFYQSVNCVLDFRKAQQVPTSVEAFNVSKIIVPDNLYDEWIVATNWSNQAGKIIRATDYEKQQEVIYD